MNMKQIRNACFIIILGFVFAQINQQAIIDVHSTKNDTTVYPYDYKTN